jgi:alkylation response protein AidB-like acyl-CoA dehydrogenase
MHRALSDEQGFLAEAASGVLSRQDTINAARSALDGAPVGSLWPLAVDAGWPGLLIGEEADGAGLGAYEAMLVLEACGAVLADARLLGHLSATAVLELGEANLELRAALAAGELRAAFIDGGDGAVRATLDGDTARLTGEAASVLDAPDADVLAVLAMGPDGERVACLLEDAGAATVQALRCYDATRTLANVRFDDVAAAPLGVGGERATQGRDMQRALLAAEAVGAADACLRMARDYAVDRRAFGRPIGSYQAIKHKLVEMLRRIEGTRSLLTWAGRAWQDDASDFSLAANAARVAAVDALDYTAPENIFIHGGIGATWEHDAQLYYRRAEVARRLSGGADAAADAVSCELFTRYAGEADTCSASP